MHRHRSRGRCGPHGRRRFPDAETLLRRLEEHQRDLEQEVADIADLIRRLKDETSAEQVATV